MIPMFVKPADSSTTPTNRHPRDTRPLHRLGVVIFESFEGWFESTSGRCGMAWHDSAVSLLEREVQTVPVSLQRGYKGLCRACGQKGALRTVLQAQPCGCLQPRLRKETVTISSPHITVQ